MIDRIIPDSGSISGQLLVYQTGTTTLHVCCCLLYSTTSMPSAREMLCTGTCNHQDCKKNEMMPSNKPEIRKILNPRWVQYAPIRALTSREATAADSVQEIYWAE